ncbi:hypothetical protein [Gallaecimonas sp. GXIMD4217]|uniref:hypothetical protein n=1 Tax=Gallaecimonas sp. GXIMD4217 TaxID=3131927 RepID=UPI00311AC259
MLYVKGWKRPVGRLVMSLLWVFGLSASLYAQDAALPLERQVFELYQSMMAHYPDRERAALQNSQQGWLSRLQASCFVSPADMDRQRARCLGERYRARLAELRARVAEMEARLGAPLWVGQASARRFSQSVGDRQLGAELIAVSKGDPLPRALVRPLRWRADLALVEALAAKVSQLPSYLKRPLPQLPSNRSRSLHQVAELERVSGNLVLLSDDDEVALVEHAVVIFTGDVHIEQLNFATVIALGDLAVEEANGAVIVANKDVFIERDGALGSGSLVMSSQDVRITRALGSTVHAGGALMVAEGEDLVCLNARTVRLSSRRCRPLNLAGFRL